MTIEFWFLIGAAAVVPAKDAAPPAEAAVVQRVPDPRSDKASSNSKFTKVEIVCQEARFDALKNALMELGITGMAVSHVLGCGVQGGKPRSEQLSVE